MSRFVFGELQMQCMRDIARGLKITEVANKYGIHRCTIHRWLRRDIAWDYLNAQKEIVKLETLMELARQLDSPIRWVSMRAAKKLMDLYPDEPEVRIVFKKC